MSSCSFCHLFWCVWGKVSFLDLWVYSFYQIWKMFQPLFLQMIFCTPFIDSNHMYIRLLEVVPQLTDDLLILKFCLFLCFILNSFCYISSSSLFFFFSLTRSVAAAAKLFQLCPTLCDPIDGSPPGSPVPGILQARTLEWVAI